MYNPLAIVAARRQSANRRNRLQVGVEFNRSAFCETTGEYYDPRRESCPPRRVPTDIYGGGGGRIPFDRAPSGGGGGYTPPNVTPPNRPFVDPPQNIPVYDPPVQTNPPQNVPTSCGGPSNCAPPALVCPENQKRYTMPFVPDAGYTASVTAGSLVQFVGKPQKLFKPDRLIIASTIAPYFDVVNLLIANIPQSLTQGNIAADVFSEVSTYTEMSFDQAYPGIDIVIVARNKSSVTQTFQAQLIGWAVG